MNAKILLLNFLAIFLMATNAEKSADGNFEVNTNELYDSAWKYQKLITKLQDNINKELFDTRIGITRVLQRTTNITLSQIETNSNNLIEMDQDVNNELKKHDLSHPCFVELTKATDVIIYVADTQSTNLVRAYNKAVDALIKGISISLDQYNKWRTDVQKIVVRSFNRVQVFTGPGVIKNNFETQYNSIIDEWARVRPNVKDEFAKLETNINNQNQILVESFNKIYDKIKIKYDDVIEATDVCNEFGSYTLVETYKAVAGATKTFFPKDKFIPVFD